jgi:hypothetical protein
MASACPRAADQRRGRPPPTRAIAIGCSPSTCGSVGTRASARSSIGAGARQATSCVAGWTTFLGASTSSVPRPRPVSADRRSFSSSRAPTGRSASDDPRTRRAIACTVTPLCSPSCAAIAATTCSEAARAGSGTARRFELADRVALPDDRAPVLSGFGSRLRSNHVAVE